MTRNITLSALALILSAGVASAQSTNQGLQQIADYLGVNASQYSATQLNQLLSARNAGDQSTFNYLLNANEDAQRADVAGQGREQLAAQAGVNAADFTTAELMRLRNAQLSGDTQGVAFILNHENRNSVVNEVVRMGREG